MTRSTLYLASTLGLLALGGCGESLPTQAPEDESVPETPSLALAANSWTAKRQISGPTARRGLIAAVVPNSAGETILYVLGGHEGEWEATAIVAYNVATNTWTTKKAVFRRSFSNGWGVIGNKIFIPGGYNFSSGAGFCCDSYRSTLWVYDAARDLIYRKADMPEPTADGVSGIISGKLYVLTGSDPLTGRANPGRLYRYNPSTDTWLKRASPPHTHARGLAGVINGKLYVIGGWDDFANPTTALDVYDPATNTWQARAPIPSGRDAGGAAVVNGRLYVIGVNGANRSTYVYDPTTNQWTGKASFPTGQTAPSAAAPVKLGGIWRVLAVGGVRTSDGGHAPSQLYTP